MCNKTTRVLGMAWSIGNKGLCSSWWWHQRLPKLVRFIKSLSLLRSSKFHIKCSTFCPHSVFVSLVWIWEQTAIISKHSNNWLVFIIEKEDVYCAVRTGSMCIIYTRSVNKVMRLIQYNSVLTFKLQIEFFPFKIDPLGGYTPPETLFPIFVATLVVANRNRF